MKKLIATSVLGIGIILGSYISTYASTTDNTFVYVNQGVKGRRVLESIKSIEKRQKIRFDKVVKNKELVSAKKIIIETQKVTNRTPPFKMPIQQKKPSVSCQHSEYFISSAYCITGYTASGTYTTNNRTIAVDPRKIRLGTKVYIEFPSPYKYKNGWYVAEDTGGAIRGNKIDVYIADYQNQKKNILYCINFGIRTVKISW